MGYVHDWPSRGGYVLIIVPRPTTTLELYSTAFHSTMHKIVPNQKDFHLQFSVAPPSCSLMLPDVLLRQDQLVHFLRARKSGDGAEVTYETPSFLPNGNQYFNHKLDVILDT